jgi:hypothetical protein
MNLLSANFKVLHFEQKTLIMKSSSRHPVRTSSLSALFVCACLFGCTTPSGTTSTGGNVDSAILAISKNRNRSEDAAAAIKQRFKVNNPKYIKAQRLYREARAENNSWLDLLQNKIRNGAKPEKSPDFNEQSKKAGTATEGFITYADSLDQPAGSQASPLIAGMGVAEIVKTLVENGIAIWKAYSEQQQAARERNAKDLERLRWDTWTGAEKTKTTEAEKPKSTKRKASE